ncbi:MAG: NADH-quinone oxidoreductase subunit J [bacterium]
MEIINFIIFILLSSMILLSSLTAVFDRNIVHSVLGAVTCFMSIAGIFFTLNADFVGIAQIFVYGVGVSILLAFAIMFTAKEYEKTLYLTNPARIFLGLIFVSTLFLSISCFISPNLLQKNSVVFLTKKPSASQIELLQNNGTAKIIGKRLFCDYVLPFELLSVLLLSGVIGAGYLARKEE